MTWVVLGSSALLAWCYGAPAHPRRLHVQLAYALAATVGGVVVTLSFAHVVVPRWCFLIVWCFVVRELLIENARQDRPGARARGGRCSQPEGASVLPPAPARSGIPAPGAWGTCPPLIHPLTEASQSPAARSDPAARSAAAASTHPRTPIPEGDHQTTKPRRGFCGSLLARSPRSRTAYPPFRVAPLIAGVNAPSDADTTLRTHPVKGNGREANATVATPTTDRSRRRGHLRQ